MRSLPKLKLLVALFAVISLLGCQNGGKTVERERHNPDESFTAGNEECKVGLLVKIGIKNRTTGKKTLTHNLKHGFSEVVIPKGYNGTFVKYEPVPSETGPYPGTFSSTWTASGRAQSASAGKNAGDIVKNFIKARKHWRAVDGTPPEVQNHSFTATWQPDGQPPCKPPVTHNFKVIFAGDTPPVPPLKLGDFYKRHKRAGFPSGGTATGKGTRVFHDKTPVHGGRKNKRGLTKSVHVPVGIYWEVGKDCCGIKKAKPKVIQFARAAIDGPNGRQGKPWTLDVLDTEAGKAPNHDPTYTGDPGSDANERPRNNGSGGTRRVGKDLAQWDAPGMPSSLYHRLLHAEGKSNYRQQFLSLLVCRPNPRGSHKHKAKFYLSQAKVKQIAITTITWTFPGQRGVDRSNPNNLRQPTINVVFHVQDGGCHFLQAVLDKNGLTDVFKNPSEKARELKLMPEKRYRTLLDSVKAWEQSPVGKVRLP